MAEPTEPQALPDDSAQALAEIEAAVAFFNTVGTKAECPFCGAKDWEHLAAPGLRPVQPLSDEPSSYVSLPYARLIAFVCKNCGFVRSHLREKVLSK